MICLIISTFHFTLDLRIAGGTGFGVAYGPQHDETGGRTVDALERLVFPLTRTGDWQPRTFG
jgi:hypothetical protein